MAPQQFVAMQMARPKTRAKIIATIRRKRREFPKSCVVFSIAVIMMLDAPMVVSCRDPFPECSLIEAASGISIAKSVGQITLRNDERNFNRFPGIIVVGMEPIIKIHCPASPIARSERRQFPSGPADSEIFEKSLRATNSNFSSKVERNGCALNSCNILYIVLLTLFAHV